MEVSSLQQALNNPYYSDLINQINESGNENVKAQQEAQAIANGEDPATADDSSS